MDETHNLKLSSTITRCEQQNHKTKIFSLRSKSEYQKACLKSRNIPIFNISTWRSLLYLHKVICCLIFGTFKKAIIFYFLNASCTIH